MTKSGEEIAHEVLPSEVLNTDNLDLNPSSDQLHQSWEADVLDNLYEASDLLDEHEEHELAESVAELYQQAGSELL